MALVDIVWGNPQNVTITGSQVQKTGGADLNYDAFADGTVSLGVDGDYIQFIVSQTDKDLFVGLLGANHTFANTSHAILFSAGDAAIYESAVYKGDVLFSAGDTFKIAVVGSIIRYYKNSVEISGASHDVVVLPKFPTVVIAGLNGKITTAQIDVQIATVPLTYVAITDRVVRPDTVVPAALTGVSFVDPDFGCRVIRQTDGAYPSTLAGTPANYSLRTPSAPNQCAWNANATRFYVVNDSLTVHAFTFDRATGLAVFDRTLSFGIEPSWPKLTTKLGVIYGVRYTNQHVIEQYTWATGLYTTVLDLKTFDASLDTNVYTSSTYVSGNTPERCAVLYGGAGQDLHMKITIFEVDTPATRRTINMTTDTINGVGLLDDLGGAFTFAGVKCHSISLSHDGNTLRIDPVGTSTYFWLYDYTLNRIKKVTVKTAGHGAMGWSKLSNEDASGSSKMQWQMRSLALASADSPTARITTPQGSPGQVGDHQSWNNATSGANGQAPFFSECQNLSDPFNFWFNEIIGVASHDAELVYRFCHHHCDPRGDVTPTAYPFGYQPLLQVAPTGDWVMFGSNWGKTLGTHPAPPNNEQTKRVDVFMVRLAQGASLLGFYGGLVIDDTELTRLEVNDVGLTALDVSDRLED